MSVLVSLTAVFSKIESTSEHSPQRTETGIEAVFRDGVQMRVIEPVEQIALVDGADNGETVKEKKRREREKKRKEEKRKEEKENKTRKQRNKEITC